MGITEAYRLIPREVSPNDLLLDPNNPRLGITITQSGYQFSPEEICEPALQTTVFTELLEEPKHNVDKLILSIRDKGFLGGLHEMIVQQLGRDKYLVLEGNRRTAALRHLGPSPDGMSPADAESLRQIPVKLFEYVPNEQWQAEDVIHTLLGSIHIDGPQEWGPLEKAEYILRQYARRQACEPHSSQFRYELENAKQIAKAYNLRNTREVKRLLTIARVYRQLCEFADDNAGSTRPNPEHYTLIDLAVRNPTLNKELFALDQGRCRFGSQGIEKFHGMCIERSDAGRRIVNNPQDFNGLARVFKDPKTDKEQGGGYESERIAVLSGELSIAAALQRIDRRVVRREFLTSLEQVESQLADLYIDGYRGTSAEKRMIDKVYQRATELVQLARKPISD